MYIIVGLVLPISLRPMFTGIVGVVWGIACVAGPLLGGVFTQSVTWRWCFYVNLPLGGAVAILLMITMRAPKNPKLEMTWVEVIWQLDVLGVIFLLSASICFVLSLQWGGITKPWDTSSVIACLVGFVVLFMGFVIDQHFMKERASYPFRVFNRNVAVGVVWNFL